MTITNQIQSSRRRFLQSAGAVGAGLVIGFHWVPRGVRAAADAAEPMMLNAFVRIAPDSTVTVLSKHVEMGQGSYTGLATLLAEELDADWSQVRAEGAPADVSKYAHTAFGIQVTGASTAISNSFDQLRRAGATARAMLVAAAAEQWQVPAAEISVAKGIVSHAASGRQEEFGPLVEHAARLTPPVEVKLKRPEQFTLIGKNVPRLDAQAKSNGTALYTLDVTLPGMLTALVRRPPRFGTKVKSVDAGRARQVPGVVDVVTISSGVVVLGTSFWAAHQGREALSVEWDDSASEKRGTDELLAEYRTLAKTPGLPARKDGDVDAAFARAARVVEATYDFPYLAHAPMEPLDCVVKVDAQGCEIWAGDQFQTNDQALAAEVLGLEPEQVRIHTLFAGGSFGRRANPTSDFIVEGVEIAKAIEGRAPVKLVWTREDDIKGGMYRPMYHHALAAALDADGTIIGWRHRIVGQSILSGTAFEAFMVKDGIDHSSVEGAYSLPYAIPNLTVELHTTKVGVPVLWWRAVGSTHTAFATEVFLDEIAQATGQDPLALRRRLLAGHPRDLAVMNLAAEKAGWGDELPPGRTRGIAVHKSFDTYVAQVAEVVARPDGSWKVERVVAAVDCGLPINPDIIRAQVEGGIGYGLSAALHDGITLKEGVVEQSNFHDYQPLRIHEMPAVEVHIVPSQERPTGIGEPGVPPIAPAVANALQAGSRDRFRALPLPDKISMA